MACVHSARVHRADRLLHEPPALGHEAGVGAQHADVVDHGLEVVPLAALGLLAGEPEHAQPTADGLLGLRDDAERVSPQDGVRFVHGVEQRVEIRVGTSRDITQQARSLGMGSGPGGS